MPIISRLLERMRQEDLKFETSLGNLAASSLKKVVVEGWVCNSMVEIVTLLSMYKFLGSISSTTEKKKRKKEEVDVYVPYFINSICTFKKCSKIGMHCMIDYMHG